MIAWAAQRVRQHATGPVSAPPPDEHVDRVLYGLTRPIVGLRLLLGEPDLLKAALRPALLVASVCLCASLGSVRRFYALFASLAPLPSLLLAGHYARLAAAARGRMGFAPAEPLASPIGLALKRVVARAVLMALAVAPFGLLRGVPLVGGLVWKVVLGLWALHWIVVDAFDSARVLRPGQTVAEADSEVAALPSPWFVVLIRRGAAQMPPWLGRLVRRFANVCDRLALPWRDELALVANHPSLMLGFALSTALLLATPVLNLLFRPIILVAAVHVLGKLEA